MHTFFYASMEITEAKSIFPKIYKESIFIPWQTLAQIYIFQPQVFYVSDFACFFIFHRFCMVL